MATTRERLREMLDEVPDDRLEDVQAVLAQIIRDDGIPIDDEPFTDEDLADIAETRAELARGETIDHDEAMRSIGL